MFATWNLIGSFSVFTLIIRPMEKVFAGTFCMTSVERSCTDKKGVWANTFWVTHVNQKWVEAFSLSVRHDATKFVFNNNNKFYFTWKAINYKYRLPANTPKCLFLIEMIWPETLLKLNHAPRLQKVHFQLMSVAQKCCCSNSLISFLLWGRCSLLLAQVEALIRKHCLK